VYPLSVHTYYSPDCKYLESNFEITVFVQLIVMCDDVVAKLHRNDMSLAGNGFNVAV